MTNSVSISILPQYVETTDEVYQGRRLHRIQQALLHYEELSQFTILTAPTGTGKSFAFPLPIINHKQNDSWSDLRCLIVSPTNALIEDMEREYKKNFSDLKIAKLNRTELDKYNVKGTPRWDKLIDLITENEVIITNPDLLNFAMFGGYIRHKGQHEISQIFARIGYFVLDEYHLYDEEQIANIISWIVFSKTVVGGAKNKFIFASATAEPGLVEVLEQQGFEPNEIIEVITENQTTTNRPIHGKIDVTFIKGKKPQDYLLENSDLVKQWMQSGDKVLAIFDRMADLRQSRIEIEKEFENFAFAEESGYFTKSGIKEDSANANLIIGTNKVEVGVNLDITVCLMQTGKHFANFVQRFGRVAREGKSGKVIVFLEDKIKELERTFAGVESVSYYEFIEKCRNIKLLSDRNFYAQKVPFYLGAYFYIITRNLKDYNTRELFRTNLKLEGQVKYMHGVMQSVEIGIRKDLAVANRKMRGKKYNDLKHWKQWWELFSGTFKFFRANKKSVWIKDLLFKDGKVLVEYSLEWVLANREVISIEEIDGKECYIVSNFVKGNTGLQYVVESMPIYKIREETLFLQQSEKYSLGQAFETRLNQIAEHYRFGDKFSTTANQIIFERVMKLKQIFTEKRLVVTDIKNFSNII